MPEPIENIYNDHKARAEAMAGPGYKSQKIREFVDEYSAKMFIDEVVEYAIYNTFLEEFPSIEVTRNYFHTVCSRCWKTGVNENNITLIYVKKRRPSKKNRMSKV